MSRLLATSTPFTSLALTNSCKNVVLTRKCAPIKILSLLPRVLHLRGHAVGSARVLLVHVVVVVMVLLVEGGCGGGRRGRGSRVGVGRRHGVAVVGRGLRCLVSLVAVRLHDLDHLRRRRRFFRFQGCRQEDSPDVFPPLAALAAGPRGVVLTMLDFIRYPASHRRS